MSHVRRHPRHPGPAGRLARRPHPALDHHVLEHLVAGLVPRDDRRLHPPARDLGHGAVEAHRVLRTHRLAEARLHRRHQAGIPEEARERVHAPGQRAQPLEDDSAQPRRLPDLDVDVDGVEVPARARVVERAVTVALADQREGLSRRDAHAFALAPSSSGSSTSVSASVGLPAGVVLAHVGDELVEVGRQRRAADAGAVEQLEGVVAVVDRQVVDVADGRALGPGQPLQAAAAAAPRPRRAPRG